MGKITNQLKVKKLDAEDIVLRERAKGKSWREIRDIVWDETGEWMHHQCVGNYLKALEDADDLDPITIQSAQQVIQEASDTYNHLKQRALNAHEEGDIEEQMMVWKETRLWFDRIARIAGLMGPEAEIQFNFQQQNVNVHSSGEEMKGIVDVLCKECRESLATLDEEEPQEAEYTVVEDSDG